MIADMYRTMGLVTSIRYERAGIWTPEPLQDSALNAALLAYLGDPRTAEYYLQQYK